MISSIFNSKWFVFLKAPFIAIAILAGMEAAVRNLLPQDPFAGYLISSRFASEEVPAWIIINTKLKGLSSRRADFVLVGDSSGFFGVRPNYVNSELGERRLINMACCIATKYAGYRYIAQYVARRQTRTRYMVVHLTAFVLHKDGPGTMDKVIYDGFISPLRFFRDSAIARFRSVAANLVQQRKLSSKVDMRTLLAGGAVLPNGKTRVEPNNQWYLKMLKAGGWAPIPSIQRPITKKQCDVFFSAGRPGLRAVFEGFKDFTDRHGLKLVLVFNPSPCPRQGRGEAFLKILRAFQNDHRDVLVPFSPFEYWPPDQFNDPMHLMPEAAAKHSKRLGRYLSTLP